MISPEYAAGFFDGEGCVRLTTVGHWKQVQLRVILTNTNREILELFKATFGGHWQKVMRKPKWKQSWNLTMVAHQAHAFLLAIRPHVRVKRTQLELALEFWEFMARPASERCEVIPHPTAAVGYVQRRTAETIATEQGYLGKMRVLNRRGVEGAA